MAGKPKHVIAEYKELMEEWVYEKNTKLNINPGMVGAGSHTKAWWKCKKGHEWQSSIKSRTSGVGCPYCAGKRVLKGFNDLSSAYPEIAKQWHPTENGNITPDQVTAHSNKKWYWLCDKGHVYEMSTYNRVNGQNCPYCNNRRLLVGYNTNHGEIL